MDLRFDEILAENQDLYFFECDEGRVIFRLLPYKKYAAAKYIILAYPEFRWSIEESIWESCVIEHTVLGGTDIDNISSGLVSTIAQLILKYSCSTKPAEANDQLDQARYSLQDAVQRAIIFICEAFPSYLPENLEKMTWRDILKRLAQAEVILNKTFEFRDQASQATDDSGKIFAELDQFTQNKMLDKVMDFDPAKENQQFQKEEWGSPQGDFNIRNRTR